MPLGERRSFASASWAQDESPDDGFESTDVQGSARDLAPTRIEPMMHPLPKHILTALALLDEAQHKHQQATQFGVSEHEAMPESDDPPLPFVPMVYQAVDWSGKPIVVQAPEIADAQVDAPAPTPKHADPELNAQVAQVADDAAQDIAEPWDDTQEHEQDLEIFAADAFEAPEETLPNPCLADESPEEHTALAESELNDQDQTSPSELATDVQELEQNLSTEQEPEQQAQHEAQQQPDPETEQPAEPATEQPSEQEAALPPGVQEDEVLQREQEHYLKGLEEGERRARAAMQEEITAKSALLDVATTQMQALLNDSSKLFEPIKRLSMHLAEQIVLGELNTPTAWIERMVQRCLDEVHIPAQGLVVVEMNARDKQHLEAEDSKLLKSVRLEVSDDIEPGSVRVLVNGMVIEEFLSHRLLGLVRSLSIDESAWREHSTLTKTEESLQEMERDDDHHS